MLQAIFFFHKAKQPSYIQFPIRNAVLDFIKYNTPRLPFILHLLEKSLMIDFPRLPQQLPGMFFYHLECHYQKKKLSVCPTMRTEGIILDSFLMQVSLPIENFYQIGDILKSFSSVLSVSEMEIFFLLGHLNFLIRFIPQRCSFVAQMLDQSKLDVQYQMFRPRIPGQQQIRNILFDWVLHGCHFFCWFRGFRQGRMLFWSLRKYFICHQRANDFIWTVPNSNSFIILGQ